MISSNVEINKRQNLERWKKQIEEQKKRVKREAMV